jgi:hypothetical protein
MVSGEGNPSAASIWDALVPAIAQFGLEGWSIATSTPLWATGKFHELCQMAETGTLSICYRHASTSQFNPEISADYLGQVRAADPEMYAREFDANWSAAGQFLSPDDIHECTRKQGILPPGDGITYTAAIDPAYTMDAFALCVGHRAGTATVIDGCWSWKRKGHAETIAAIADVLRAYRVRTVLTDQYAPVPIKEALGAHGIMAEVVPWTSQNKVDAMTSLRVQLSTRQISLPKDDELSSELATLEATPTATGLTRIKAAGSAHDDRAIVVAAVANRLGGRYSNAMGWISYQRRLAEKAEAESLDPLRKERFPKGTTVTPIS